VVDPNAPMLSIRACTRTGSASPTLGRAAHLRLVRHQATDVVGTSRATDGATDARTDDRQLAIHILRNVGLRQLRGRPPAASNDTEDMPRALELALVELGTRLSGLVGADGYRALIARAVDIAASEFPFLNSVEPAISSPGRLVGLPGPDSRTATPTEARNAAVAMLAEVLWLLNEFIGRDLTQRIVVLVWPCLGKSTNPDAESQLLTG